MITLTRRNKQGQLLSEVHTSHNLNMIMHAFANWKVISQHKDGQHFCTKLELDDETLTIMPANSKNRLLETFQFWNEKHDLHLIHDQLSFAPRIRRKASTLYLTSEQLRLLKANELHAIMIDNYPGTIQWASNDFGVSEANFCPKSCFIGSLDECISEVDHIAKNWEDLADKLSIWTLQDIPEHRWG